jgi:alpha-galactosidase-like protein
MVRRDYMSSRRSVMSTLWRDEMEAKMRQFLPDWKLLGTGVVCLSIVFGLAEIASAEEPVALRVGSFMVAPAHMPPVIVSVRNLGTTAYDGTIRVKLPDGWKYAPAEQPISLSPGETGQVRFNIKEARTTEDNLYPVEVTATGAGTTVTHRQDVVCASAPYFKPEIDGKIDDWEDAIGIIFNSGERVTVIGTYWNRRQFSILVGVEEDKLVPYKAGSPAQSFDAVQVAISPRKTVTGSKEDDEATRYEFLFASTGKGTEGRCFQLAEPGMKLSEGQTERTLADLEFEKAKIAVGRKDGVTYYECQIPFRSLSEIKASEGREFFLSVLVHDPDGTGVRDWGQAAGLWPSQRNRLAWSRFTGAQFGDQPPFDNKTQWGMCSSKY